MLRYCTKVFNKICNDEVVANMPREFKCAVVLLDVATHVSDV